MPHFWTSATAQAEEVKTERLAMATIGLGYRGVTIGSEAAGQARMVACADVKRDRAEQFAGPPGNKCQAYTDYRRVLDRKDVQAIICATPDHWHTKIAVEAMWAGKDVYCEKPLTLTIAEGKLICNVVRETGKVFQVGTQQRSEFNGCFLEAIAIARSGRLGKKLHAQAKVGPRPAGGPFPDQAVPADLNWDFWLGQAPAVPYTKERFSMHFRYFLEYSGGEVTDWGVHNTDIALWALGGETSGPIAVEGKGTVPLGTRVDAGDVAGQEALRRPSGQLQRRHRLSLHDDASQRQHDQPGPRQL